MATKTGKRETAEQAPAAPVRAAPLAGGPAAPGDDFNTPVAMPLYLQVKSHLIRRIVMGEWKPGELLPSEFKLAEGYGLSQGTVRKAIEELAVEGLVSRHPGRGTFVTSHKGDYRPFRFHQFYSDIGRRLVEDMPEYLSCTRGIASPRAAKALQIDLRSEVAEILRRRRQEGVAVMTESIVISSELCPGIETILQAGKPASIYLTMEQHFNLLIVRVEERVRARLATTEDAQLLELSAGTPLLEVERVAFSLGGGPVEWRLTVCETSHTHYLNQMAG